MLRRFIPFPLRFIRVRRVARPGAAVKPRHDHRAALGKLAETLVLGYFLLHGWRPFPRPKRELVQTDLLLRRGTVLLLVEVKARRHPTPLDKALSHAQRQRLQKQAAWWAARVPQLCVRLDVVVLVLRPLSLTHHQNILA